MPKGKLPEFVSGTDWSSPIERLEFYYEANDIVESSKKRAMLFTICGEQTYETMRALVAPKKPSEVDFVDIIKLMTQHFDPRPSELLGRYRFQKRDQLPNEDYVTALRTLAKDCNFGNAHSTTAEQEASGSSTEVQSQAGNTKLPSEVTLRDRLVCGINDSHLQQRLLAEDKLTFEKAYELVFTAESAKDQQRQIQGSQQLVDTFAVNRQSIREGIISKPPQCFRCLADHKAEKCFKNATCNICRKKGHIAKACLSNKAKAQMYQGSHCLEEKNEVFDEQDDCDYLFTVFHTKPQMTTTPRIVVTVRLSGRPLEMEVDLGAAFSIISGATFARLWPQDAPVLRERKLALRTWSGECIDIMGSVLIEVSFKKIKAKLPLLVAGGVGASLLRRNRFEKLGITLHGVNNLAGTTMEDTLAKFSAVFDGNLTGHSGPPVRIDLAEDATPKFLKCRQVPFALRDAVCRELDKLQAQGII
ncbi:uncharacterized protein LOC119397207 [Rhipicephalus sanguineus]|uniref:uncharacterized protein LOC119397207 n=1 Tax=Rhipicephalus sanguineus TaxID=34632 RepID=UPI001895F704|nr:uncharacterized protein LOC119397207 [Rhipicephalus sanguineus]